MKQKAPGKGLLQVVGIILVVIAVLGLAGTAINIGTLSKMNSGTLDPMMESVFEQAGLTKELLQTSIIFSAIQTIVNLTAGIMGIVNCNKIQKANICFVFGILMIVTILAEQIYNLFAVPFQIINVISIVFNLILPLLYFWGALKNRQVLLDGEKDTIL